MQNNYAVKIYIYILWFFIKNRLFLNTLTNDSHTNALLHAKTKATGAAKQTRPYTHTCEISGDGLYSQKLPSTMNKLRNQTHEHTYKKTQTHTHTNKREM